MTTITQERREARRRYTADRRSDEVRKKYWRDKLLPILIGLTATSLVSWGVYVTHLSYTINAKYEEVFLHFVAEQKVKEAESNHRLEIMNSDFNDKLLAIRGDMSSGMTELRDAIRDLYDLLIRQQPTAIYDSNIYDPNEDEDP